MQITLNKIEIKIIQHSLKETAEKLNKLRLSNYTTDFQQNVFAILAATEHLSKRLEN